ncbi:glycoside hydrolase family 55 protein [Leucobacter allii]|uniref:Glycoside hydrolase family 55 protein n=1 Tax=Leucobacter allii TaxID=2932247 RepID=A0ABY4FQK0_9MICO|nr:glycoside hydrolase family 55 protein [Leucobacter allii]UOQ58547.1 glycoside hydrolase family 55 protein [Leucobacter allii]
MVIITGRVADSAGQYAAGRIEFSQAQRIDTGELLVTGAVAVAQVTDGELRALDGAPFVLPANPEGTAVRVRELLGGRSFEWWTAVPDVDAVEYRELPAVETAGVPASPWGPPPWLVEAKQMRDETVQAIADGRDIADALGGLAGINAAVAAAEAAAVGAAGERAEAASQADRAEAAADSIDMSAINTRLDGVDAEIAGRTTQAQVETLVREVAVSVKRYGAVGNGVANDGPAIQAALNANRNVFIPPGTYIIGQELKVPSNTRLVGAGIDQTILRASSSLHQSQNMITNAKNSRTARTDYDRNIYIADMTVDSASTARPTGGTAWESGACGVNFATVEHSQIERVKSINAPLYCFTVDASIYRTTEDAWEYMPGPSRYITIRDCIGIDSRVDDAFTTHYSHDILIEGCVAIRTIAPSTTGGINNGFEVDEGSYRVTLRNCYATGWETGFQIKGHEDTRPARDVWLYNCIAEGCGVGYALSGTASTKYPAQLAREACNVLLDGCMNIGNVTVGTQGEMLAAIKIYSYSNVTVRDFRSVDSTHGGITMVMAEQVTLDGIVGENVWNLPAGNPGSGWIRLTSDVVGGIKIRNVEVIGPVTGPLIRNNATGGAVSLEVDGVIGTAPASSAFPLASDAFLSTVRTYRRMSGTGFSKLLEIRGGSGATSVLEEWGSTSRGAGTPEGNVVAPPGYLYLNSAGGAAAMFIKRTGTAATGWAQI